MKTLDFYLFLGSTYTYLTVNRIEDAVQRAGLALRWRPFDVRTIMIEQNNRPFVGKPIKTRYMWRDIERRAKRYGIAFGGVPPYPVDTEGIATRVALVAEEEGWCGRFAKASYRDWFLEHHDPGDRTLLAARLERLGRDAAAVLARAESAQLRLAYDEATVKARELGIFGSPTFAVDGEIFWGDDRLEDAIDWARGSSD